MATMSRLVLLLLLALIPYCHSANTDEAEQCADGAEETPEYKPEKWTGQAKCKVDPEGNCLDRTCVDRYAECKEWAKAGGCGANPRIMLNFCIQSCNICNHTGSLTDLIAYKTRLHHVEGDESLLETKYGMKQHQVTGEMADVVPGVIKEMEEYMESVLFKDDNPKYHAVRLTCKNRHASCAFWKSIGECENNPEYMSKMCAPFCQLCHVLVGGEKCPIDETAPIAFEPGHVDTVFSNIVNNPSFQQYTPTVLSMPDGSSPEIVNGPWVIELHNFVSPEEAARLVGLGHEMGYERSSDGKRNVDGTAARDFNDGRTSSSNFCRFSVCLEDPVAIAVTERMENLTGVPQENFEYLQLLKYEEGQYYRTHHDYAQYHLERQFGARVLTVFLYLNDVEAGGATEFPHLNIAVKPVLGNALVWPSVLSDEPDRIDMRTEHGAQPVEKGIKYGANAWIHMGNFRDTFQKGCW